MSVSTKTKKVIKRVVPISLAIIAALSLGACSKWYDDVTWQDYSAAFGLESGKEYPLVIGKSITGVSGNASASASAGFFSAQASTSVSLQPDQALTMDFTKDKVSYILSLPVSKTTFLQREDIKNPTVKVKIQDGNAADDPSVSKEWRNHLINVQDNIDDDPTNQTTTDAPAWPGIHEQGLGTFVGQHLQSVTITLPPELYQKILGRP